MATPTLNAFIAAVAAFLAIGTLNRMNGTTSWSVRFAVILIFVSMLGQSLGYAAGAWDHYCDTMLFAGICAFLLACRRNPIGIPWPWNEVASYAASAVAVMIVFPFGWLAVLIALGFAAYKRRAVLAGHAEGLLARMAEDQHLYALRVVLVAVVTLILALVAAAILPGCTTGVQ